MIKKSGSVSVEDSYYLDHKHSILHGFNNNILPIYISNISNLEMIPSKDNISKSSSSSISENELFKNFKV